MLEITKLTNNVFAHDSIAQNIFSRLEKKEKRVASEVCKKWRKIILGNAAKSIIPQQLKGVQNDPDTKSFRGHALTTMYFHKKLKIDTSKNESA